MPSSYSRYLASTHTDCPLILYIPFPNPLFQLFFLLVPLSLVLPILTHSQLLSLLSCSHTIIVSTLRIHLLYHFPPLRYLLLHFYPLTRCFLTFFLLLSHFTSFLYYFRGNALLTPSCYPFLLYFFSSTPNFLIPNPSYYHPPLTPRPPFSQLILSTLTPCSPSFHAPYTSLPLYFLPLIPPTQVLTMTCLNCLLGGYMGVGRGRRGVLGRLMEGTRKGCERNGDEIARGREREDVQ